MNILLDPMPDFLEVSGQQIPIDSGFPTWLRFDEALFWNSEPIENRIYSAMDICYSGKIPVDTYSTVRVAIAFYAHISEPIEEIQSNLESGQGQTGRGNRSCSFTHDASLIYAAFRAQYGIGLTRDDLHWWHFKALFEGLSDDNKICKTMKIRALDLSKVKDKEQKAHYRRLKRVYKLPDPRSEEEREADMIDALAVMF